MFPECSSNVCLLAEEGLEPEEHRRVAEEAVRERAQEADDEHRRVAEVRANNNTMHVYTILQRVALCGHTPDEQIY